jgi:CDP-diglyceride synthetase
MTEKDILSNKFYLYLTKFFAGLYGYFCISFVSAWNSDAVPCQVHGGQYGRLLLLRLFCAVFLAQMTALHFGKTANFKFQT